jgi:hypothetical protein
MRGGNQPEDSFTLSVEVGPMSAIRDERYRTDAVSIVDLRYRTYTPCGQHPLLCRISD